jgi:hypothetical protein
MPDTGALVMSGAAVRCRYSECMTVMKSDLPVVRLQTVRMLNVGSANKLASPADPSAQAAHSACNPICGLGQRYLGSRPCFSASGRRRSASRALVWARQAGVISILDL